MRDPVGDVANFLEEYERSYGANHPPFHRGSYAQVKLAWEILYNRMLISGLSGSWGCQTRVAISSGE